MAEQSGEPADDKAKGDKLKLDMQIAKLLVEGIRRDSIANQLGISLQQIEAVAELLS